MPLVVFWAPGASALALLFRYVIRFYGVGICLEELNKTVSRLCALLLWCELYAMREKKIYMLTVRDRASLFFPPGRLSFVV